MLLILLIITNVSDQVAQAIFKSDNQLINSIAVDARAAITLTLFQMKVKLGALVLESQTSTLAQNVMSMMILVICMKNNIMTYNIIMEDIVSAKMSTERE